MLVTEWTRQPAKEGLMDAIQVLYVGDSEVVLNRYLVGADVIEQSYFNDNGKWFREAMANEPSVKVRHITPHGVASEFPTTLAELQQYQVVIFSDVGYNSMIFYPGLTPPYVYPLGPDRVGMVKAFVEAGGGFLMTGGYLSFAGINGMARWGGTDVETILPVNIARHDDRVEMVQGFRFTVTERAHPTVAGLPWDEATWTLCGYNRLTAKVGGEVIARYGDDPFLVCGGYGRGRTAAFASDFAPHWAGDFVHWPHYTRFWTQMVQWLAGGK
ncbi:MAG: cytoplasmic protein [Anaerolineae bacterium]|nr:cytoplasmic protein [Anaerolineae bacterium]MBN8618980.1 cytoplasmic protein [Anaerolineae bacterium]